jgi:hypothetical protein
MCEQRKKSREEQSPANQECAQSRKVSPLTQRNHLISLSALTELQTAYSNTAKQAKIAL